MKVHSLLACCILLTLMIQVLIVSNNFYNYAHVNDVAMYNSYVAILIDINTLLDS